MTSVDQTTNLMSRLNALLGAEHVLSDADSLEIYAQDIWKAGEPVAAVVRPADTGQLVSIAQLAAELGICLAVRGGGMSYTRGYTQTSPGVVMICTQRMNAVLEINTEDMTVTVQAGCTWSALHEALGQQRLRTPYWGPLSGRYATVGGSVSQNSIFWGGSRYGSSADSVVSMEVVLANGDILRTGSAAQQHATPFFRHFGPDLTGLFCSDCGALGLKATITLKLMPDAGEQDYLSFDFNSYPGLLAAMAEITRQGLASECFGFDPLLTEMRAQRDSLMADARSFGNVLAKAGSLKQAASDTLGILKGGRRFMKDLAWPLHAIVEEKNSSAVADSLKQIRSLATASGGTEVSNAIPKIMRANPFGPVNNMIGPGGERWAPVHGLLPLSQADEATTAVLHIFAQHEQVIERFNIRTGFLYNAVAGSCIAVEPLFFWPDSVDALHRASVDADFYRRLPKLEQNLEARNAVASIRQGIADKFSELGAAHLQIGRSYQFSEALEPAPRQLLQAIKTALDPDNRINPGVLGLS
ncbi:putative FAD-linked oxidoreductase [Halioglobus japonicus]|nr:putative FAD-linked oxidoreductase [Halioglobus japonicus]